MDKNWTKIFASNLEFKAMIIKGVLEDNDIECVTINKKDSAYLFGEVEVYVPTDQALLANQIINSQVDSE